LDQTDSRSVTRPRIIAPDGLETPRRQWAWATIMVGITLAVLDGTIANVALPTIAADFNASPSVSIWIVNGYQLAIVTTLLPFASLGEIYGYRRIYLFGVVVFTLSSLACALSGSLELLTASRIVQGIGAAGLMSVNSALLRYIVPRVKFGTAIGLNALVVGASSTIGPTLAGSILAVLSWQWLFVINVPLGILTVIMGWRSLPENDLADRPSDLISAILSASSIGLIVTTIDSVGHGLSPTLILLQAVLCVLASTLLVRRELGMRDPLLPLDLLKIPVFALSIGTSVASFTAQILAYVSLPFIFQNIYGFTPAEVGMLIAPWPAAVAIMAPISGKLSNRHSTALLGSTGLIMLAAGLLLLAFLPRDPSIAGIAWRMALCGIGFGCFQSPNNRTLILSAPRERSGAASGMLGTARLTGQTIGAALVALLLGRLGLAGATTALLVGAGFAILAAIVSVSRYGRENQAKY
jgi:DHA2 family multidrug resistance protein-like MFS transporter